MRQHHYLLLITLLLATTITNAQIADSENIEEAVCGSVQEPFVFWLWSRGAGKLNPEAVAQIPNAESIAFKTRDSRILKGYRLRSSDPEGTIKGSLLVAQGNAMLADQLLSTLNVFAKAGIETYIYDYRGYGNSEGARRLKAIVGDYKELSESISTTIKGKHYLYGISFGGVVLLNAIGSGANFDRIVIDSTPSQISTQGCPETYDPIANFPKDGTRSLVIVGEKDKVVPLKDSQKLIDLAQARGGKVEVRAKYAHPFMDSEIRLHQERIEIIRSFFLSTEDKDLK